MVLKRIATLHSKLDIETVRVRRHSLGGCACCCCYSFIYTNDLVRARTSSKRSLAKAFALRDTRPARACGILGCTGRFFAPALHVVYVYLCWVTRCYDWDSVPTCS